MPRHKEGARLAGLLEHLATVGVSELSELEAHIRAKETELTQLRTVERIIREVVEASKRGMARRGGRPRKVAVEFAPPHAPAEAPVDPPRKRMGRPPKVKPAEPADETPAAPKRRGRPPKPRPELTTEAPPTSAGSLLAQIRNYLEFAPGPRMPKTIADDLRERLVTVKAVLVNNRDKFKETGHGWVLKPAGDE